MYRSWRNWCWQLGISTVLAMCGAIAFFENSLLAEPNPDRTLGAENSIVTPNVDINGIPSDRIDGGARREANLFHSFRELNVEEGRGVYFTNPVGVENILSRVTGGNASEILGKLGVLGKANLFLINPNGIIFGANASLDISGSFVASTASSLKFADETQFSAIKPQTAPLLTVSVPIGLQFGGNAGNIQVQGNGQGIRLTSEPIDSATGLRVQPDRTLALVGGNLDLEGGTLKTAGGRVELGSVVDSGLVSLNNIDKGFALDYEGITAFGNIQLSGAAVVDASGLGGGDIQVIGRQVILQDGSQIEAATLGSESGGTLTVNASDFIELRGRTSNGVPSGLFTRAYSGTTGTAGNLRIDTGKLIIRDGAVVLSGTSRDSKGQGGNLSITADAVELKGISPGGQVSRLSTQIEGTGDAGDLTLNTRSLTVQDGAFVSASSFGTGRGGNLSITADSVALKGTSPNGRALSSLSTQTEGTGDAGDLTLNTRSLTVQDGAFVSASSLGIGRGGELRVKADDSINLSGTEPSGYSSGLFTSTRGVGQAGNITIDTNNLRIADGAVVSARTNSAGNGGNITVQANTIEAVRGGQILTSTRGSGQAGNINLNVTDGIALSGSDPTFVDRLTRLTNLGRNINNEGAASGIFANTASNSTGAGGTLRVTTGDLTIGDEAKISVSSQGAGIAGGIVVTAGSIRLEERGAIAATTNSGRGGNINLQTRDLLTLRRNSEISTNAFEFGNGGNINIDTNILTATGNSDITANAIAGAGGNIQISTQGLFRSPDSAISASSDRGIDGVVEINRPDFDPNAELVILPTEILDVSGLIAQGCSAEGNSIANEKSQFLVTGRGGLPPTPQAALNSDNVVEDWGIATAEPQQAPRGDRPKNSFGNSRGASLVEAQGWQIGDRGEVLLTANATDASYYSPKRNSTGCHAN